MLNSKKEEGSDSPVKGLRGRGGLYRCVVILLYTLRAMTRMRIQATQRSTNGGSGVNSFVAMKVSGHRRVILVKVVHASPGIFDEAGESYMNMLPSRTGNSVSEKVTSLGILQAMLQRIAMGHRRRVSRRVESS